MVNKTFIDNNILCGPYTQALLISPTNHSLFAPMKGYILLKASAHIPASDSNSDYLLVLIINSFDEVYQIFAFYPHQDKTN